MRPERRCPHCGGVVERSVEVPLDRLLGVVSAKAHRSRGIIRTLAEHFPLPVSVRTLIESTTKDDPEGGPECIDTSIRVTVSRLRVSLTRVGWTINHVRLHGYVLERVARRRPEPE